jgi:hypothetical protein
MSRRFSPYERMLQGVPERDLLVAVLTAARLYGWLAYHTLASKGSAAGFPDLVLVRAPRVIFAELKKQDEHSDVDQRTWALALMGCPGMEYFLWRPGDMDEILEVLK